MITPEALNGQASNFRSRIHKLILNDSIEISGVDYNLLGNQLELVFEVPENMVYISSLKIKDIDDVVLVNTSFYVEVIPNTFFKYRITFKGE